MCTTHDHILKSSLAVQLTRYIIVYVQKQFVRANFSVSDLFTGIKSLKVCEICKQICIIIALFSSKRNTAEYEDDINAKLKCNYKL